MSLSRAERRAKERRNKKNKLNAQIVSVSMLTSMGFTLTPGAAFAAVINDPASPTVIDSCGVDTDRTILEANADVMWYQAITDDAGNETLVEVEGEVAADGLEAEFVAVPATEGDTFADGSAEIRFPVNYTDVACIVVTTNEPVFSDYSGTENDRVEIPETVGVQYFINGEEVAPGTYDATGNVTITAEPEDGYEIAAESAVMWENLFDAAVTAVVVVAAEPIFTDDSGTADDVIIIPESEGVQYLIDGEVVVAGEYPGVGDVVVEAEALLGFELDPDETSVWNFAFDATATDVLVSPAAPTFTDELGTENDVVVIPESEGVEYSLDGDVVAAGEYPGVGTVTVVATATDGYDIDPDSTSTWEFAFDNAVAADVVVSPAEPVFTDLPGVADDEYTIPESEGVEYTVDGEVVAPGTYAGTGTIAVEAVALDGYALDPEATALWNFTFATTTDDTVVSVSEPQFLDESGIENDQVVLPDATGVIWYVDDVVTEPGTYAAEGTVVVRAEAAEGYAIAEGETTVWTNAFSAEVTEAQEVVVEEPSFSEELNVVTIPDVEGLQFFLNGEAVSAGSYPIADDAVVTATVEEGYSIPEGTVLAWNYAFTVAPVDTPVDEAPVDEAPVVDAPVIDDGFQDNVSGVPAPVLDFASSDLNCTELGGVYTSEDPEYRSDLDTNGNGIACEANEGGTGGSTTETLRDTGASAGLLVLLGAGGLLTAAGAGTVMSGRLRKKAEV